MKTPQKQIQPFDGLWRVNLSFAYWNVKLYKIMVQLKGREKKIARGNSVSCFSGAYFPNQIESECSDWSWPVQRKVRNLTFTVELDRLRVIRTNFFLLKNITYLKFKRFQSIRQTRVKLIWNYMKMSKCYFSQRPCEEHLRRLPQRNLKTIVVHSSNIMLTWRIWRTRQCRASIFGHHTEQRQVYKIKS